MWYFLAGMMAGGVIGVILMSLLIGGKDGRRED